MSIIIIVESLLTYPPVGGGSHPQPFLYWQSVFFRLETRCILRSVVGHLWPHSKRFQHLCARPVLEGLHPTWRHGGAWSSDSRSQVVSGRHSCHGRVDTHNPRVIAVNAVSLVLALVANLALLLNMARRVSFSVAQPITIVGFYLAAVLLIALVAAAAHDPSLQLPPDADRALTQAFYYAIMAATTYCIIATLMVITVYGAIRGEYHKQFELTMSQRSLMLQTICFLIYLLGGAAVFARIEGWKFLDAVYWADVTLLTVGIGDYSPMTHLGRSLLFPYAIGGVVIIGLVIGSIRSLVLGRGKAKIGARLIEKKRKRVLQRMAERGDEAKITPLSKADASASEFDSERERREAEFNLMREIHQKAMRNRKWTSLGLSTTAWLFLWFMGALVFYKSERNQGWTYFGSLYFAYTSLLTIGYGDLRPMSNSGKSFFVFWSLLAVPTLTILVRSMGDTVVKGIRDLVLYGGEFTVLPGDDKSTRNRIKRITSKVTSGKVDSKGLPAEEEEEEGNEESKDPEKGSTEPGASATTERMASQFEEDELNEADAARNRGDKLGEDIHNYHYLLVREIRNVMNHLHQTPPREYTYKEWAWFLKLIGEDEDSAETHRAPPLTIEQKAGMNEELRQERSHDKESGDGKKDGMKEWSWLGNRSPLMGDKEEAEWVLERLSQTLELRLKQQREHNDERGKKGEDDTKKQRSSDQQRTSGGSSRTLDDGQLDDALAQAPKEEAT